MDASKRNAILKAVNSLKTGPYKATGLKVEFEAQVSRERSNQRFLDSMFSKVYSGYASSGEHIRQKPMPGVVYAQCYVDGSVDTEVTLTIDLKDPETVFLLPKLCQAFADTCKQFGKLDTAGAGMHMAPLSNKRNVYPAETTKIDMIHFENFAKSMALLIPALFFLASPDEFSRGMNWRKPGVQCRTEQHGYLKGNAVNYKLGALEFRLFETCYQRPEAILDNVVVMANAMKFWTDKFIDPGLGQLFKGNSKRLVFGNDSSRNLGRLYNTPLLVDLLYAGLDILKPSYYTIAELRQQRNFKIDPVTIHDQEAEIRADAMRQYREYAERFAWFEKFSKGKMTSKQLEMNKFVESKVANFRARTMGEYSLN